MTLDPEMDLTESQGNCEPYDLVAYTDGSKKGNVAGSGWLITRDNAKILEGTAKLGDASVYQAELMALKLVIEAYLRKKEFEELR